MPTKTLGPWQAGLNLVANRGLSVFLRDNELGEAENVVISDEGFLAPRPGCKIVLDSKPTGLYQYGGRLRLIGNVNYANGEAVALVSSTVGTGGSAVCYLYKVTGTNSATLLFSITGAQFTSLVVHSGFISAINTGDYTYPADTGVIVFTDNAAKPAYILSLNLPVGVVSPVSTTYKIPASNYSMIVKDRLFLFDYVKNIMWWSPAQYILDFRTDTATTDLAPYGNDTSGQEIIEPGVDSDTIRAVEFYNNNFYIFKRMSTFMFTYQLSPLTDGYMRKISDDMGAMDSTIFQEKIIVVNDRGIFRIENTDFIDLQSKMNFQFEFGTYATILNAFIVVLNNTILVGWSDAPYVNPNTAVYYYYSMNINTGSWSKWSYDYINADKMLCPKPFGSYIFGKPIISTDVWNGNKEPFLLFVDTLGMKLLYMSIRPNPINYHLDSSLSSTSAFDRFYIPNVAIKTTASVGNSMLNYKKLYRFYTRFYLSEAPALVEDGPVWTISVNYDSYQFDSIKNPIFNLYPVENPPPYPDPHANIPTVNYFRAYQLKIPQQRAREFVFELKRKNTTISASDVLVNPDADRPVKNGYYFMLTSIWFDYQDKALI